jgi:glycosyltransferase involved in cell wall biosynthesis
MIGVLVITYQRAHLLAQTIAALRSCVDLGHEAAALVIADDGSTDGTHALVRAAWPDAQLVISDRAGLGANANAGLRACWARGCDTVLQLQDDMLLNAPLPLGALAADLRADPRLGWIRLWEVEGQAYTADLHGRYWHVRWESDDAYIASDRPHLKTRALCGILGDYPEGLPIAATEPAWCMQAQARALAYGAGAPRVGIPIDWPTESGWVHLGLDSHKLRGL